MMENGFSSPRSEAFPAGLRVLVVDDDLTWLKILEKMLKKCSYEVTTCSLARDALNLLRGRKDGYDIVISDVNMPDMDGFKLLEHVGLEMDLPVIMMSVDGEMRRVMRGVQHGACDYLLKPIRMKELRNIWQHVFRRKIHEVRDMESHEVLQLMRHGSDQNEDSSVKKRKDVDTKYYEFTDSSSSSKKPRVVWAVELHQKFVEAVNKIGLDKAGPKRILDSMKVPWLSRENVASHLQKYRLYLSRLQKENGLKGSSDLKFSPQNSINSHQNDAANGSNLDLPKAGTSELGFSNPLALLESEMLYAAFDSTNPTPYCWDEVPEIQFKQDHEPFLQYKPLYDEASSMECAVKSPHVPSKGNVVNCQAFETISLMPLGIKNEGCNADLESVQRNLILGDSSALACFNEDLQFSWLQGDCDAKNLQLQTIEFSKGRDLSEVPLHMYDTLRLDYEYPCDPIMF